MRKLISPIETTATRPIASGPLVTALIIALLAAVIIQGLALIGVSFKEESESRPPPINATLISSQAMHQPGGQPAAITNADDHLLVTLNLPGTNESTIEASLENDTLTITCQQERVIESHAENGTLIGKSKRTSHFHRAIPLPTSTRPSGLETDYENGILSVRIPK